MKVNAMMVFAVVSVGALVGMTMGGLFGYAAGSLAPELFSTMIPCKTIEPIGTATVLGAVVGVLLGGGLGVFSVLLQSLSQWLSARRAERAELRAAQRVA